MALAFDIITPIRPSLSRSYERNIDTWLYMSPDGTYNHLTFFEKKSKYEDRTTRYGARLR